MSDIRDVAGWLEGTQTTVHLAYNRPPAFTPSNAVELNASMQREVQASWLENLRAWTTRERVA